MRSSPAISNPTRSCVSRIDRQNSISFSMPWFAWNSRKTIGESGISAPVYALDIIADSWSISSIFATSTPDWITSVTAFDACSRLGNSARPPLICSGRPASSSVARVTTPRVPSLPISRSRRLYPEEVLTAFDPAVITDPSASTTSSSSTQSATSPYLTVCIPLAAFAIIPPIVEISPEEGSGGKNRPYSPARSSIVGPITPGWRSI